MNRRSFISSMLKAAVACAVLPAATTYARAWKPLASGVVVPYEGIAIDFGLLNTQLVLMWNLEYLKANLVPLSLVNIDEPFDVSLVNARTRMSTRFVMRPL